MKMELWKERLDGLSLMGAAAESPMGVSKSSSEESADEVAEEIAEEVFEEIAEEYRWESEVT